MLTRRHLLTFIAGMPALARADLYDDYINSTSKQPFVAFLARQASVSTRSIGHAFVGVGVQIDAGLRVYERFFGLYPKDGLMAATKSVLTAVSGRIDATWEDTAWDASVIRRIDEGQKRKVLDQFEEWNKAAPAYALFGHDGTNCNGLVAAVARSAGMRVPDGAGTTRPWKFIEKLKSLNP